MKEEDRQSRLRAENQRSDLLRYIVEEEWQARLRADNQRADLLRLSRGGETGQAQG